MKKMDKKKSSEKIVFMIIIFIFVFSSALAYSSLSIKMPAPPLTTPEAQKEAEISKELASKGINPEQYLLGVIKKLESGAYSEGTHYLEVGGITLAVLEADDGVDLDIYIGKNVKVWGESRKLSESGGAIMKVKLVQVMD